MVSIWPYFSEPGWWGSGGVGEWGIERVRDQGEEEEVLWDVMGFSASSRFF